MKPFSLKPRSKSSIPKSLLVKIFVVATVTVCFLALPVAVNAYVSVTGPDPQSIDPNFGLRGTTVNPTITGAGLENVIAVYLQKDGESNIDAQAGSITATATSVSFTLNIPGGAALGEWNVWVSQGGVAMQGSGDRHYDQPAGPYDGVIPQSFTILSSSSPEITSISPTSGAVGTNLLIVGKNFGATRGSSFVSIGGENAAAYGSWSDATIACTVPDLDTGSFPVRVTTSEGVSNSKTFNVTFPVWYLAEGSTAWGYSTYISIENPNDADTDVRVTYMTEDGPVTRPDIHIPAMSQATVNPQSDLGNIDFSTKVEALDGRMISVDRTMIWTAADAVNQEGHNSVGVPSPLKTWYLAEGSSEWGFECWLLIQNPNDQEATCQVTYMIEGSPAETFEKKIPANSRRTYNMENDIGKKDSSIKVDSDFPVIPERAMYRNGRREGHESIGTAAAGPQYFLAEGTTAWGFTTYVLIQNPNDSQASVNITYMTSEGEVQHPLNPIAMPANSRKTVRVNDYLPGKDFSTKVVGDKSIIAERAMYWDNGTGEACHDSIGISEPHTNFYLPDGQTDEGRETWTLVQNPNAVEVDIEISYLNSDGTGEVTFEDTLPALSRKSYNLAEQGINGRAAVKVSSRTEGAKIIVERAMYWNSRGAGTDTIGGYSD